MELQGEAGMPRDAPVHQNKDTNATYKTTTWHSQSALAIQLGLILTLDIVISRE
jgi:hypothetical protein